jgi:hypothetical protein
MAEKKKGAKMAPVGEGGRFKSLVKKIEKSGKSEDQILKALDDIAKKTYTALPSGENYKKELEDTIIKNRKLLPSGTKGTVKSETIPLPEKTER